MSRDNQQPERRPDGAAFFIAALLAGLGGLLLWDAARLPQANSYAGIGAASAPWLIGVCLIGLAAWTVLAAFRAEFNPRPRQEIPPVLWVIGGLALQLLLLHTAGFILATAVMFACAARAFGKREVWISFPIGLALSAMTYGVFDILLRLNLPGSWLENIIFGG